MAADAALDSMSAKHANITTTHTACYRDLDNLMAADAALDSLSAKHANITTTHTACYRDLDNFFSSIY